MSTNPRELVLGPPERVFQVELYCADDVLQEIANRHVAAPAIAASHQLRVISANKFERTEVAKNLRIPKPGHPNLSEKEKKEILEAMEPAVYGAILGAFVQGLEVNGFRRTGRFWLNQTDHFQGLQSSGEI